MSKPLITCFNTLESEVYELKVMYWLVQAMEIEKLEEGERQRIAKWFNSRYDRPIKTKITP